MAVGETWVYSVSMTAVASPVEPSALRKKAALGDCKVGGLAS